MFVVTDTADGKTFYADFGADPLTDMNGCRWVEEKERATRFPTRMAAVQAIDARHLPRRLPVKPASRA